MLLRALLSLAIFTLAVPAAPAQADVTRKKAMWGPLDHNGLPQMPVYADLGVGIYQMALRWDETARSRPGDARDPQDAAYQWPPLVDRAIREAAEHGIQVSLLVMGTPGWANGGREWRRAPDRAGDYGDFLAAAARRYPSVRHWMIWGEPTKAQNFQPMDPDRGRELRGRRLRGPRKYAQTPFSAA